MRFKIIVLSILLFSITGCKSASSPKETVDLKDVSFKLQIEDTFSLTDRKALVVVGVVDKGQVQKGNIVMVVDSKGNIKNSTMVTGLEMFGKLVNKAKEGDAIGIMLSNMTKDDVTAADYLVIE